MNFKEMLEKLKTDVSNFVAQFDHDVKKIEDQIFDEPKNVTEEKEPKAETLEATENAMFEAKEEEKEIVKESSENVLDDKQAESKIISETTNTKEDEEIITPVKKRGRPKKNLNKANQEQETLNKTETVSNADNDKIDSPVKIKKGTRSVSKTEKVESQPKPSAKKRGRPAKNTEVVMEENKAVETSAKKKSHPAKTAVKPIEETAPALTIEENKTEAPAKKRGRPAKAKEEAKPVSEIKTEEVKAETPTKKRGRPAKNAKTSVTPTEKTSNSKEKTVEVKTVKEKTENKIAGKKRGRPKKEKIINEEVKEAEVMGIDDVEVTTEDVDNNIHSTIPQAAKINGDVNLSDVTSARAVILNSQPTKKRGRPKKKE